MQEIRVSPDGNGTLLERRLSFDANPVMGLLFRAIIGPLVANPSMNKSLKKLKANMEKSTWWSLALEIPAVICLLELRVAPRPLCLPWCGDVAGVLGLPGKRFYDYPYDALHSFIKSEMILWVVRSVTPTWLAISRAVLRGLWPR